MSLVPSSVGEAEELGMVALMSLIAVPGLVWIARSKSGGQVALRSVVVAGLLAGAVVVEASMDRAANSAAGVV